MSFTIRRYNTSIQLTVVWSFEIPRDQKTFLVAWTKSRKSYCTNPGIGVGVGVGVGVGIGGGGVSKKFNVKVFYVMGKALSGKLSCPCDRSC